MSTPTPRGVVIYTAALVSEVYCDGCCRDFTDSPASGGAMLPGWALCAACAEPHRKAKRGVKWCPEGMSFADFVRASR